MNSWVDKDRKAPYKQGSKVFRRNLGPAGTLLQISDIDAAMATTDFRQVLVYTAPSP
ncbi:hypothetical protein NECAME_14267, partial [Necator americanus]